MNAVDAVTEASAAQGESDTLWEIPENNGQAKNQGYLFDMVLGKNKQTHHSSL